MIIIIGNSPFSLGWVLLSLFYPWTECRQVKKLASNTWWSWDSNTKSLWKTTSHRDSVDKLWFLRTFIFSFLKFWTALLSKLPFNSNILLSLNSPLKCLILWQSCPPFDPWNIYHHLAIQCYAGNCTAGYIILLCV